MKIGVIGPPSSVSVVQSAAAGQLAEFQLLPCRCEDFRESAAIAGGLQRDGADAVLFTGPAAYEYSVRRVTPAVPWAFLPHSRVSFLQALAEAAVRFGGLGPVSIDGFPQALAQETLAGAGAEDAAVFRAPYGAEEPDLEQKLLDFHRTCLGEGRAALCVTGLDRVCRELEKEGLPCVRLRPTAEEALEQLSRLCARALPILEYRGNLAVVAVRLDDSYGGEGNPAVLEWEAMSGRNLFREQVYLAARQLQAAVFEDTGGLFYLATTRTPLEKLFLEGGGCARLLRLGQGPRRRVYIGVGVGDSMLQARSLAATALGRALEPRAEGPAYLAEGQNNGARPLGTWQSEAAAFTAQEFAQQVGLSIYTLKKLAAALEEADFVTSDSLASLLGVTPRSANRIILRLEEKGYAAVAGKTGAGKGRPARIIRIFLPESVSAKLARLP